MANISDDEKLIEQINEADDLAGVISVLKNAGIDLTEEELLSELNVPEGELTEESLEGVAGGVNFAAFGSLGPLAISTIASVISNLIKKGKILGPFGGKKR